MIRFRAGQRADDLFRSFGVGRLSDVYVERAPVAALAGIVSSAWIQRAGGVPYVQRNVPNGSVELRCSVGSAPRVVGPLTAPSVDVLAPGETVVGLRFHPGAAPAVLGTPASELVDAVVEWEGPLGELVASADDPVAALQAGVAMRASPDALVLEAVRRMRWHADDVALVRSSLFISERQLRRRCVEATGLPPKTLHRLLRFQSFLALAQAAIAAGRAPDEDGIAMLAAEAGYADQPHLNRECLRMTEATPAAFLGETAHRCADGHDHAASFRPVLRARA
jgi:AraC-like DNA-binding protein